MFSFSYLTFGKSGIGKSALLANWSKRYKEHHPEDLVFTHYIGCSPASTSHISILNRIMSELQHMLHDFSTSIPYEADQLIETFPHWVEKILQKHKRHRFILVLDGLENIDDRGNALDLLWFPQQLTNIVRVFVSACEGRCAEILRKRNCESITVTPLSEAEVNIQLG